MILMLSSFSSKTLAVSKQDALNTVYSSALTNYRLSLQIADRLLEQGDLTEDEYNITLGTLAYRRGNYPLTLSLYKRLSDNAEGFGSNTEYKKVLNAMIESYLRVDDIGNASLYARKLQTLSAKTADRYYEAAAIFWMGRISHAKGSRKKAYRQMEKAINLMRTVKSQDYDGIFYESLITRIEYMQRDGMNREEGRAVAEMEELSARAGTTAGSPQYSMTTLMQKDLYAHKAVCSFREGDRKAAETFYRMFQETGNAYQCDYQCILPYLKATARYDDIIRFARIRIDYLHSIGTDYTFEMAAIYNVLAEGYYGKGNYRKAAESYQQLSDIKNEIINRMVRGGIAELTSVYDRKKTEKKSLDDDRHLLAGAIILTAITATVLTAALIYVSSCKRKMARKNRHIISMTDELRGKDPLLDQKQEEEELKRTQTDTDKILFDRMWKRLVDDRLYLQRDFNRDTLVSELKIPKNKFSALFTNFTGQTYLQCITQLRLNHAVELLKSHPAYTVEAVAEECGMSITSFYRLFAQHYGMTPTEYRETIRDNKS